MRRRNSSSSSLCECKKTLRGEIKCSGPLAKSRGFWFDTGLLEHRLLQEKAFSQPVQTTNGGIRMPRTERCFVREFKTRMCALEPGDVLAPLSSPVPSGYRILVLDRTPDGGLNLSLPCDSLRIVADKKGPFRWLEEAETLVDSDSNPHELIELGTMVAKGVGLALVSEYRELDALVRALQIVSRDRVDSIVNKGDTPLRRRIDAVLMNDWLPSVEGRIVAAFGQIFARPLTENEQAHVIALVNFVSEVVPVLDVVILPSDDLTVGPLPPHVTH